MKCSWGFSATRNSYLNADNTYASDSTNFAYACVAAYVSANGAVATQNVTGFLVQDCGTLYAAGGGTSHNSFTGVQALCYALYTQLA